MMRVQKRSLQKAQKPEMRVRIRYVEASADHDFASMVRFLAARQRESEAAKALAK